MIREKHFYLSALQVLSECSVILFRYIFSVCRKGMVGVMLALLMVGVASCYYEPAAPDDRWDLPERTLDSIDFVSHHYYGLNYNFLITGDSLVLLRERPSFRSSVTDSFVVRKGARLVVADFTIMPSDTVDSVWVKVAHDQQVMGWVRENRLLDHVVPDDSISQFIHFFSNKHLLYLLAAFAILFVLYMGRRMQRKRFRTVHIHDIASFYPTGLCLTISGAATLYASIQNFVPQTWVQFYYQPTLNPFGLPFVLSCFLICVWLILMLTLASIDDVRRQLSFPESLLYLLGLSGVCMLCYLFFSVTTLYYVGYPCFVVYVVWALRRYFRRSYSRYACGVCGAKMRTKGKCPRCGAWNE